MKENPAIARITTEEASASGVYDKQYPEMGIKARDLRKRLMGTDKIEPLLSPELTARVNKRVKEIAGEAL